MMNAAFPSDLFAGRRYAVAGLGRNGTAVVSALLAMGAQVHAWDDKLPPPPSQKNLTAAPFTDLHGFDALILSPGIPHLLPQPHPVAKLARAANVPIFSDAELLFQAVRLAGSKARFASVTGTNGKSTTTALLAHMLECAGLPAAAGGNLGTASLGLPLLPDHGVYVIEMSSYMLERLQTYHAATACLLNLTPDHLDRHGDMEGYAAAKTHVFDNMTAEDLAVIGIDDSWCRTIAESVRTRHIPVETVSVTGEAALTPKNVDLSQAHTLLGAHNAQNALAAIAMARHLGLSISQIQQGLNSYPGLAHRQQKIGTLDGIDFINDSKATNAEAAEKALGCYDRIIWIAGGIAKSGGIEALTPWFGRIAKAYLIGLDAPEFAQTLQRHGVAFDIVETLDRAVPAAFAAAKAHHVKTVLLSPACASFDQFSSFEARGSYFIHLFTNLIKSETSEETLTKEG
ncbi:UDP-N-acetylmuramoyl-L-alanine--D-glutamate ligase [Kozakia baliensis]|uniref:UDP-N-acetylmuramoyl-L-alanine--D-glutamate ligase n=1 Tax=Kozakia baliensis TaxID=153496 RepID=UPI000A7731F2